MTAPVNGDDLPPMPAPLKTRDEAVGELLELFRRSGYDGTSLSDITNAVGLGKSSLYNYFPGGKAEMAGAVLELVDDWLAKEIVGPLGDRGALPEKRLERMLQKLDAFYEGGKKACILERLCASADRRRFRRPLARAFASWVGALAELCVEAGVAKRAARARAEDAVLRIEGALVLCAGLDTTEPFTRTLRDIRATLLA